MKLLLDIGNTRIKWGFDSGAELAGGGEFVHGGPDGVDLTEFLEQLEHVPKHAAAVNVAGAAFGSQVAAELEQRFGCMLRFIKTASVFGSVKNGYTATGQLGADRWAAIVAAWERYRTAVCVVDAGSATTIDLVAANGQHFGGIILPGLALMQTMLKSDTSDIAGFAAHPHSSPHVDQWYGRDTSSAVVKGSLFATTHAIDAAVKDFPDTSVEPKLVLTGGDALQLSDNLPRNADYRPMLVLEGLRILSQEPN